MSSLRGGFAAFWRWYQRNYLAVLVITTAIFLLQLFHLYWLFTDVVLQRLFGRSFYGQGAIAQAVGASSLLADYLEIPTLISASLVYVNELRKRFSWGAVGYLVMLNTQWAHILWITDEVVVETLAPGAGAALQWNAALAWIAILIDFLEVPVIVDTLRRVWAERDEIVDRIRSRTGGGTRASGPAARTPARAGPHLSASTDAGLACAGD